MQLLGERFVLGTRNIEKDAHVGLSHGYACDQTAVGTTNGAGGRNVQMLVLAADGTVVHALPGFWHAEDLLPELRLGLALHDLYMDDERPLAGKLAMFAALHRAHVRTHGADAARRGDWQPFDQSYEMDRAEREPRDTVVSELGAPRKLKTIPQLVHDRLLARPFKKLAEFDIDGFVDYGRPFYDNNQGFDRGRNFGAAAAVNAKREREEQKADREAAKEAAKDAAIAAKLAKTAKPAPGGKPASESDTGWKP